MRIQVGLSKILDKKTGKPRPYKYSDIPTDLDKFGEPTGWVSNLKCLPIPFDLMYMKVKQREKIISGWWNGQGWEGLRMKKGEKVIKWKRNQDHD
jgi:hypothetical protein